MDLPVKKIAVLGEGITGKAVRAALTRWGVSEYPAEDADWIVASPGIPPANYPRVKGEIISDIELAYRVMFHVKPTPKLIGITGTNGKSTVTAMIGHILDCPTAGNIGIPLINFIGKSHPFIAVEISSYQLESCTTFTPEIALFLNLTPDHLERHKTLENYGKIKAKICKNQSPSHHLICGEDPIMLSTITSCHAQRQYLSNAHPLFKEINLPHLVGNHNRLNALAALLACLATNTISLAEILEKLSSFKPLEHRLEWVKTWKNIDFYNDSKGTNPDATLIALSAFTSPIHLLLGGKDKGLPLDNFVETLTPLVSSVALYGEIAPRLKTIINTISPNLKFSEHLTLTEATQACVARANPQEIILLSPACSSFDQFNNFEERGIFFKNLIHSIYV